MIIVPILTTSCIYISLLKGWEDVRFELGSERVELQGVSFQEQRPEKYGPRSI